MDRAFWIALSRLWPRSKDVLVIVSLATVSRYPPKTHSKAVDQLVGDRGRILRTDKEFGIDGQEVPSYTINGEPGSICSI